MVPWNKSATETEVVESFPNGKETEGDKSYFEKQETSSNEESKETFRLTLGKYKGATVPLVILLFGYTCGALAVSPMKPDPRVKSWFLMDNSLPSLTICVLYVLFSVVWGPNLMKDREPFKLRKIMISYNFFQVIFSTYMFFEVGFAGWFFEYNFFCEPCDYSWTPKAVRIASIGWLFFISKIVDFIDTLFFVLNKKWAHISMLHVVHHSCMCISMWYGIKYTPGGHITFMGYLNSGVHAFMYTYYFLSAFGPALRPYLWWKKYLTKIQLIQFVAIFIHAAQLLVTDCPNVPKGLAIWTCIYAFIFFTLFIDFYYRAYLYHVKKNNKKLSPAATPHIDNVVKEQIMQNGVIMDSCHVKSLTNGHLPNGHLPNGHVPNGHVPNAHVPNGHIRSPSNLSFRLDTCLRDRQSTGSN